MVICFEIDMPVFIINACWCILTNKITIDDGINLLYAKNKTTYIFNVIYIYIYL